MYGRPKRGETEDEILLMQEAYFKEKESGTLEAAAKVVDCRKEEKRIEIKTTISKYAKSKGLKRVSFNDSPQNDVIGDIVERKSEDKLDDSVYFPKPSPVLGDIVEKNVEYLKVSQDNCHSPLRGFPLIKLRNKNIKPGASSIFAQQMVSERQTTSDLVEMITIPHDIVMIEQQSLPSDRSFMITGKEADKIHNENINLLKNVSEEEILEEKRNLESSIDPSLIAFIKSKRQKISNKKETNIEGKVCIYKSELISESEPDSNEGFTIMKDLPQDIWENDILSHPDLEQWLHFDKFEKEKLEWMEAMNSNVKNTTNEPYEARFDLKGWLQPYSLDYTEESKVLYHHGEESHRPGYSIKELMDLSRSTVLQQKAIALNTLAGILEYHNIGAYQNVLTLPITKIFFTLRFALDDNKILILEPTLKALRNLFYNRVDEACLDGLFAVDKRHPNMEKDMSEIKEIDSEESELKDFHLTEINLIAGAVRTDILIRMRYILNILKPNFNCVQYCLQILCRFVRDSAEIVTQIINLDHFVMSITEQFFPISTSLEFNPNVVYGRPVVAALKFVRTLVAHSKENAEFFVEKCNIMQRITTYINLAADSMHALKVQIEALQLWSLLLQYGYGMQEFVDMGPVLMSSVDKHVRGTDLAASSPAIILAHASSLISLLSSASKSNDRLIIDSIRNYYSLLQIGLRKWILQVANLSTYTTAHLIIPSVLLIFLGNLLRNTCFATVSVDYEGAFKSLFVSKTFRLMSKELLSNSNLLSGVTVSANISSMHDLGSSLLSTSRKVLPCISAKSPIQFLSSMVYFLRSATLNCRSELWQYLEDYVKRLTEKKTYSLQDNWFTRVEISLLLNFVQLSQNMLLSDMQKDLVFLLSHKLLYLLSTEHMNELKVIFTQIIFNKDWFSTERLISHLSLTVANNTLNDLQNISSFYYTILGLDRRTANDNCKLSWKEYILPKDWIYMPIVALYSKSQDLQPPNLDPSVKYSTEVEKGTIIKYALRWVIFSEIYFPEQMSDISLTDRLCRIMCVFLCDTSLFLDPDIKNLLSNCLHILYKIESAEKKFDFDGKLEGMYNFQDFYTQFADHFQAVSYGDENFASCLLVPLAQRHNAKWKKLLWSEYAGCLRALDCSEMKLCYSLQEYLHPEEEDQSLLKCYHRALSGNLLRQGTVSYKIASHHVEAVLRKIT